MAFVFTVEDGSGVAGANSYASVAEADDYFAVDPNFLTTWNALAAEDQEILLAWASRVLDQKTIWKGYAVSATQTMGWPRTYVTDRDGYAVDSDIVPTPVKAATFELAKFLNTNDLTVGPDTTDFRRIVVDVIEIEYQEGVSQNAIPTILKDILTGYGVFRVGGRGAARIIKA
jgi:hypothetical protein